jgi:hypothetical protein
MTTLGDDLSRIHSLNSHEQLTYGTGAIAQHDVALEMSVFRLAADVLLAPWMDRASLPRDFERLRESTKEIVRASEVSESLKTKAIRALGNAKVVHRARVELVHDQWGLVERSDPPAFVVLDALMGRGWPDTPPSPKTLDDFEAAAHAHVAAINELATVSMELSRLRADEATARFVETQIAIHLVGGPFNDQYRAALRNPDHSPPDEYTEEGATYARDFVTVELDEQANYRYTQEGSSPKP